MVTVKKKAMGEVVTGMWVPEGESGFPTSRGHRGTTEGVPVRSGLKRGRDPSLVREELFFRPDAWEER